MDNMELLERVGKVLENATIICLDVNGDIFDLTEEMLVSCIDSESIIIVEELTETSFIVKARWGTLPIYNNGILNII